ncbi:MAG: ethanolamine ammonia-lyase subunit EutC [Pseudobdellovibrionaceae bacterium]
MSAWEKLKHLTSARIGLGRIGFSLPSHRILEFQRAHASARSAVWQTWDPQQLINELKNRGHDAILLSSKVKDRENYLRFPNKGRLISDESKEILQQMQYQKLTDLVFVISDGLSALAVQNHFLPLWNEVHPLLLKNFPELNYKIVVVPFGRVAISDEIGENLKAQMSVIFLGERPGLNSPDSLGIYMTYKPTVGNSDAQRNCISNVRTPGGLNYQHAAIKLIYLMKESLRLQLSGVNLKDDFQHVVEKKTGRHLYRPVE